MVAEGAVAARSDAHGNVEPRFDFVYLDGAKNWTIDGLAVVLVEKLLRPGGWLLMDDLEWTYAQDPGREATDGIVHRELSEPERTEPHLRAVFDLIVAQHPSFTELRRQDEWWGWARKTPGEPRRYTVKTSQSLSALLPARRAGSARRARRRLASSKQMTARALRVRVLPAACTLVVAEPRLRRRPSPHSEGVPHASRVLSPRPVHPSILTSHMRGADALIRALERAASTLSSASPAGPACRSTTPSTTARSATS